MDTCDGALSIWSRKSLSLFPLKPPLHMMGLFLRMLSLSRPKIAIQVSVSTVSPLGMNSRCTTPAVSKKRTTMVFLVECECKAFRGLSPPLLVQMQLSCLVSGSKTENQDSSVVMTCSSKSLSLLNIARFSLQSLAQKSLFLGEYPGDELR